MIGHPLKVRELLDEIDRGELLLPEFQRAYVWKAPQVVKLIDSLYHEYPTGQLLLWDTKETPLTKELETGTPSSSLALVGRPKIVLDGQQRLTSLYKVLAPKSPDPVDVWFHIESEQFQLHRARFEEDPMWVPVRSVLSQDRHDLEVLQAIGAAGGPGLGDPEIKEFLDRLRRLRRIAEYSFPIEIFRSDDFEEVTELFVRINSGGTRLRQAELVLAQLTLRLPGTLSEAFEEAIELYEAQGFALDPRFLVRALVAVATGQSRLKNLRALWARPPEELAEAWARTRLALDRAVDFVRQNARFQSSDWVPSLNALIPLVAFFEKHAGVARHVEVGLLRWFYLACLRRRFSSSAESRLDQDLTAVASEQPVAGLLENLMLSAGKLEIDPEEFETADWRNPLFPVTYALARRRSAADWFSGVKLGQSGGQVLSHPIFPKGLLADAGIPRKERDEVANLVFLSAPPPRHVLGAAPTDVLPEVASADPERLSAQSIPMDLDLWHVDRYRDFVAARRKLLAEGINQLLDDPL